MYLSLISFAILAHFVASSPLKLKEVDLQVRKQTTLLNPILYQKGVDFAKEFVLSMVDYNPYLYSVEGNANEYADKLVEKLKDFLKKNYDPLNIEPQNELKWLKLEGLSTIYRSADTTLSHKGLVIVLDANLGFHQLIGSAFFEKQLWWVFWISGTVHANIKEVKMHGVLSVDMQQKIKPHLDEFDVTDWGTMEISLEGENWIGKIVQFFAKLFPSILTDFLKNNVPGLVKDGINQVLESVDFDLSSLGSR